MYGNGYVLWFVNIKVRRITNRNGINLFVIFLQVVFFILHIRFSVFYIKIFTYLRSYIIHSSSKDIWSLLQQKLSSILFFYLNFTKLVKSINYNHFTIKWVKLFNSWKYILNLKVQWYPKLLNLTGLDVYL